MGSPKSSGKALTIFMAITAVLLISLTALAVFFFRVESKQRKEAEAELAKIKSEGTTLEDQLGKLKKQVFLLEEKNKEADERINGLLDELDLQEGLRGEMKKEVMSLREQMDKELKTKEKLKDQLIQNQKDYEQKIKNLEEQLTGRPKAGGQANLSDAKESVNLSDIVVSTGDTVKGSILSVDAETKFLIINIGSKAGVQLGDVYAVSRDGKYLGDIRATRIESDMSAADLIPPLSISAVQRGDDVTKKE